MVRLNKKTFLILTSFIGAGFVVKNYYLFADTPTTTLVPTSMTFAQMQSLATAYYKFMALLYSVQNGVMCNYMGQAMTTNNPSAGSSNAKGFANNLATLSNQLTVSGTTVGALINGAQSLEGCLLGAHSFAGSASSVAYPMAGSVISSDPNGNILINARNNGFVAYNTSFSNVATGMVKIQEAFQPILNTMFADSVTSFQCLLGDSNSLNNFSAYFQANAKYFIALGAKFTNLETSMLNTMKERGMSGQTLANTNAKLNAQTTSSGVTKTTTTTAPRTTVYR